MKHRWTMPCLLLAATLAFLLPPPAAAQPGNFVATLSSGQTVPRASSQASGSCTAVLLEVGNDPGAQVRELSISCEHNIEDSVAAHVHLGAAGQAGPVIFPFADPRNPAGRFAVSDEEYVYLLTESLYVNVHSPRFPSGEIRGQLRLQSLVNLSTGALAFPLGGDQVVPPVTTAADGRCVAGLDNFPSPPGETPEVFLFCHHSVMNPTAAHIHLGAAGANGPVAIDLGDPASPIVVEAPVAAEFAEDFLAGELPIYVQVHSMAHPAGEIRGQVAGCFEGPQSLCLQGGRFQVEGAWRDFEDRTGPATAVRESLDSGILWFFGPDNAEVLIKVLDACNSPFNSFWVFYAATTNVEFTITVTDTRTGEFQEYTNDLGVSAAPVLDTDAFATCP